ncbi:tripartite tricarboxylate transporter substrate binding protein [Aquincola sp. MAHUQ-54]|uniref:Tripartite tricarboxylate transporter substrate binding protein n=1 Tax=Aquincola agrisoli TaxID=3119538 RepID=A0AAW9QEF1_9BURK
MKILSLVAAVAAFLLPLASEPAAAQTYPSRSVRIIVPYQPGQGTDVATRYLAEYLTKAMGQSFFVENRAGAGGNIGASEAARAAPDGYTLVMGTNGTHVLNQYLYGSMPFDPEKDFEPVMLVSSFPMVVLAAANSPYNSLSDLLAEARAKPDTVNVALPSTTARLVLELLKQQSATSLRGIPYKGSGTSMTDLVGGQVPVAIDTVSASRAFISSGKLKALGVTSLNASALLPGVKPVAAQGVDGFQVVAWNGLYVPRGTPPAVVQKLNAELGKILALAEVRHRLLELGHEPALGSPAELADFAKSERHKWGPLITKVGLKAE